MAAWRDRLIPWYFVAFFVILAAVDGWFVMLAVRTQPGTIIDHPYERGIIYNRALKAYEEQEALGWKGTLTVDKNDIRFRLRDAEGKTLAADSVSVRMVRPTRLGLDTDVKMEKQPDESWSAKLALPAPGLWEARVNARAGGHDFQQSKRVVLNE